MFFMKMEMFCRRFFRNVLNVALTKLAGSQALGFADSTDVTFKSLWYFSFSQKDVRLKMFD